MKDDESRWRREESKEKMGIEKQEEEMGRRQMDGVSRNGGRTEQERARGGGEG